MHIRRIGPAAGSGLDETWALNFIRNDVSVTRFRRELDCDGTSIRRVEKYPDPFVFDYKKAASCILLKRGPGR